MIDNINKQYERVHKIIKEEENSSYKCDREKLSKFLELEVVKIVLLSNGYDSAIRLCKGQFYNTTKEFLNSIYPCETIDGQCCLYCKRYGECNGFN